MAKSPLERRQDRIGVPGQRSERNTAKRLAAKLVRGSGSGRLKGDMWTLDAHIEAKSTISTSIAIKLSWLVKITKTALARDRMPAVTITFTTRDGRDVPCGAWVMIPEKAYHDLVRNEVERQPVEEASS